LCKSRKDVEEEKKARQESRTHDTLDQHRKQLFEVAKPEQHHIVDIYEEVVSDNSRFFPYFGR
jgi:site-specific DNA recombinase